MTGKVSKKVNLHDTKKDLKNPKKALVLPLGAMWKKREVFIYLLSNVFRYG